MKKLSTLILIVASLMMASCATHMHTVGDGAKGNNVESKRQWYLFWGLAQLNDVNTAQMAGNAKDYQIKTQQNFVDGLINVLTYGIVHPRSVTVTR
ncbi:MAG: hypothetical protein DWQ06_16425 [Calditrichaeota bacterium]|nr:MAG: hypothetical protein DWQ06_16425 [Calditrichota bacterium]